MRCRLPGDGRAEATPATSALAITARRFVPIASYLVAHGGRVLAWGAGRELQLAADRTAPPLSGSADRGGFGRRRLGRIVSAAGALLRHGHLPGDYCCRGSRQLG